MERPDFRNHTPEENVNLLFNMIQACRTDLLIMIYRPEYKNIKDTDIVKAAESLARDIQIFNT